MGVFAVDDCSAQLTWRASPAEGLRLEVGDTVVEPLPTAKVPLVLDKKGPSLYRAAGATGRAGLFNQYRNGWRPLDPAWPAGPGAAVVDGLAPGQWYDVVASARGAPAFRAGRLRTLTPPGGRELCRFATVSDVHIGERYFGVLGRLQDVQYLDLPEEEAFFYPFRALRAAMAEAADWGAGLMVVKGDLTRRAKPAEVRDVACHLAAGPVPVETLLGNHDNVGGVNARAILGAHGLPVAWGPRYLDLEGVRLVLVDSVHGDPRYHRGQLLTSVSRQVAAMVAAAPRAAWVGLHHPPELHPYPLCYPPGIPYGESREFLDALAAAGKPVLLSAGHRHRNRRNQYGPVEVTEVGSTKDYPGVWGGYKVFEGGIMQVVRRVARADVLTWTENTRRAMNGQWGRWSPGRLDDRCFSLSWPV